MGNKFYLLVTTVFLAGVMNFFLACSGTASQSELVFADTTLGMDPEALQAYIQKNDRFQRLAITKIRKLEKELKTVKKSQDKLKKASLVMLKNIRALKAELDKSGKAGGGISGPELQRLTRRLDSLATIVSVLAQRPALTLEDLAILMGQKAQRTTEPLGPPANDKERIRRQYGPPQEEYLVNDRNLVWVYPNGVAVFDLNGNLVSQHFSSE